MMFDLENGNWKNSEVVRLFVQAMEEAEANQPEIQLEPQVITPEPVVAKPTAPQISTAQIEAELELFALRKDLAGMAKKAALAGDIKAAWMIERTIQELTDLAIKPTDSDG